MDEGEAVHIKVLDEKKGDVVFEGKVSTDVTPYELVQLRCFLERSLYGIFNKATNERVKSFKGLHDDELVARSVDDYKYFSGVLYARADDRVLRKSKSVPSCKCVLMHLWDLSEEECEKAIKCGMLEELDFANCQLKLTQNEIGKLKTLEKLSLGGMHQLKRIPEEIGELSNLEELYVEYCWIESLPKSLKVLKFLNLISLEGLSNLQLHPEDVAVFSRLNHLTIKSCQKVLTPSFVLPFWEMIKSTTDLRVLELDWYKQTREVVVAALEENGSIIDGGRGSESHANFFKRNRENHKKALQCVVHLLAIRRWRNALSHAPKEMVRMIAIMLWNTKCDVGAWAKQIK